MCVRETDLVHTRAHTCTQVHTHALTHKGTDLVHPHVDHHNVGQSEREESALACQFLLQSVILHAHTHLFAHTHERRGRDTREESALACEFLLYLV